MTTPTAREPSRAAMRRIVAGFVVQARADMDDDVNALLAGQRRPKLGAATRAYLAVLQAQLGERSPLGVAVAAVLAEQERP